MDFFKSVFSNDLDPSQSQPSLPDNVYTTPEPDPPQSNANPSLSPWTVGGLIRNLTTRSESVIETYRRDLLEFGSGLKKEIQVAQGSLGTVGTAIDELGTSVLNGTAQIIAQGKEVILTGDDEPGSSSDTNGERYGAQQCLTPEGYSRFHAQVRVLQRDIHTYCEEPDDFVDYSNWRKGFVLEEKREETEVLLQENGDVKSVYDKVVPDSVDDATFWCRYFYKVFKIKKAEDLRANIAKRAISQEDEEELSWDVDDDEEEAKDDGNVTSNASLNKEESVDGSGSEAQASVNNHGLGSVEEPEVVKSEVVEDKREERKKKGFDAEAEMKINGLCTSDGMPIEKVDSAKNGGMDMEELVFKSNEKMVVEEKAEIEESHPSNGKDSDFSVVSSHPSLQEEEDLEWDEIEDLSMIDDKKMDHGGSSSTNRADPRKRLSAPEEDDLSWDIDDDEPDKLDTR